MALYVSPEQKKAGEENFVKAVGQNRRDFLKICLAAGATVPIGAAMYFGYRKLQGAPVKTALIGAGDEGGVLVGAHNPDYLEFVAVCDIRPSNRKRIFTGEDKGPRLGLNRIYGKNAEKKIKQYTDYQDVLRDKDIEAVVIALPLHLHAQVSIEAMQAGKHVLCEKLMAWNVAQCKRMITASRKHKRVLSIGHQRHYSLLYQYALEILDRGILGDVKHIRALWHRNNAWPMLNDKGQQLKDERKLALFRDSWRKPIPKEDEEALAEVIRSKYGYKNMEELVRWRLFQRTGGGLMAELGSHQLDACSIFLGKVRPLAVSGVGTRSYYREQYSSKPPAREVHDHVFVTFEFPGKNYYAGDKDESLAVKQKRGQIQDRDDIVIVTYSSINTNSFEPYGECVMGTKGTLVVEKEETAALYPERDPNKKEDDKGLTMQVRSGKPGEPVTASSSTEGYDPSALAAAGQALLGPRPVSRGYREEMEDFAYCVRMHDQTMNEEEKARWREGKPGKPGEPRGPRCNGVVAMADAILALASNAAMTSGQRIEFKPEWFEMQGDDSALVLPPWDLKEEQV